ncbi:iron reductase domain protein, partial [Lophiostoma macrostomum CBS 122681]
AIAFYDSETGFTFSEYKVAYSLSANVVYRIAVPSTASSSSAFDIVVQVVAPNAVGWSGLAWGGNMVKNPLTVGWANGNSPIVSSRWATGHTLPTAYTGASYTKFTTGNRVNGTHWTLTAKCTGCSAFAGSNGNVVLNPKGSNRLAFAYSASKPTSPGSNSSSFPIHDVHNYWSHDFSQGENADFDNLVKKNG